MRRFFAPEVVQTSNMDCGPASLKCLLEGFGKRVSYGRLREACQTGIDGTSIDTMEAVANQLGLEAEQIMIPPDHLLLSNPNALPALVVVKLPNGLTHFVVAWRRHGPMIQVMDPAVGRRWVNSTQFLNEIYGHTISVPAADWREFAVSEDFQRALRERMSRIGFSKGLTHTISTKAIEQSGWLGLGALDAAVRLIDSLVRSGGMRRGSDCARLVEHFRTHSELIPVRYWSVRPAPLDEDGQEHVFMRGAVLVRVRGTRTAAENQALRPELVAAIEEKPAAPGRALLGFLWESGRANSALLTLALAAVAAGVLIEALLFRGLFDVAANLGLAGQRMGAMAALLIFGIALLVMELSLFSGAARLGRQIENRLRVAFLAKIPKLGDRYFQSRLTSDMAERSHATHRLRHLPDLARQLLHAFFELAATAAGIIWLEPAAAPFVLLTLAAALVPAFGTQSVLAERDLRVRSHAAGLTRFYLDSMLGLLAIRAHGAERSVRREHEKLMGEWAHAALRLQRTVATAEALQLVAMFGLIACLLLVHPLQGSDIGRVLLVVYWALNLPTLGQDVGALARQYPYYRNLTLRLLDPLGAPEEAEEKHDRLGADVSRAPSIQFENVWVQASGHSILEEVNLRIEPGTHVAIVGPSGAGKSSLVGILLGWLKPSRGDVRINESPLDCERLRSITAWVDPAVQLWNRSLFSNIAYGSEPDAFAVGKAIDAALLRGVLESLPEGLQTKLGEGGALVSGGEGQRVRLARATLRRDTRLVILDEPFRGLDRDKRRELLARAREFWRDCTMLCVTHDLAETQAFDRVVVVERGRVAEDGSPRKLAEIPESRYAQLLEAECQMHSGLWSSGAWRRIRVHSGRIIEELPRTAEERRPETEVA